MTFLFWVHIGALLFSFFVAGVLLGALFSQIWRDRLSKLTAAIRGLLTRSLINPILRPGGNPWTAEAVLNPAALLLEDRVHLIYRAVGMDGVSRLGYASSPDGVQFDTRLPYPVYVARNPQKVDPHLRRYSPVMYPSGGSWGGCEDPRMVMIEDRVYVTFNMFENWALRVGLISISKQDFLNHHFTGWEGPLILSHGTRDKNWVLFPEKIDGKFAVLHSIFGEDEHHVRVEYADDLAELPQRKFESADPQQMADKQIAWHYRMRSAGPPPLRTKDGWLVLYHAMDPKEPTRYKLGAMLLDFKDPTHVLHRSVAPILEPDAHYENHGKPGIVYACGAIIRDGNLFVYYGGADKVVCVASTPLTPFLKALREGKPPVLISSVQTKTT